MTQARVTEGKSGVNVRRLVSNIADQYDFAAPLAAVIELVANSLDAAAQHIEVAFDPDAATLSVTDDGCGMTGAQFHDYHDFAASSKRRGAGIGFAGQGAKLALNFCTSVKTETASSSFIGTSEWRLVGEDAPYRISPWADLDHSGARVTLLLKPDAASAYSVEGLRSLLLQHYQPLFDADLLRRYRIGGAYAHGVEFLVNGEALLSEELRAVCEERHDFTITVQRKPRARGFFGVLPADGRLPVEPGVAVCTYGKVIEREFFRKEPLEPDRIYGWIEAPYLIDIVTTDKCRFQRDTTLWQGFYRKAQDEFSAWLEESGQVRRQPARRETALTNLEREINSLLREIPELRLFGSRQRTLAPAPDDAAPGEYVTGGDATPPSDGGGGGKARDAESALDPTPPAQPGQGPTAVPGPGEPAELRERTVRSGIRVTSDERRNPEHEAYFDGATVVLYTEHPAYQRAERERAAHYHLLKCVALSVARFHVEEVDTDATPSSALDIVDRFFAAWGHQ